jgi:DMSO/TMAO reductase YedYZ molybdopterin-dependent catalytic subunit
MPDPASNSYGDLNVLSPDPICAGVFLPDMDRPVSATEGHFIRSHFAAPKLSSSGWALPVTGEVDNPLKISYEGLLKIPSQEVVSLMECAGNSRSTMQPPAEGVQWDNGGLSVSRWKGVSVKTVLEQARLKGGATDVLFVGADSGKESHSNGTLAYEMNGEVLPLDHGYPIRLLVPGWYGMTSVKWLTKMVVMDHPNGGFHEMDYWIYPATNGNGDAKARRSPNSR